MVIKLCCNFRGRQTTLCGIVRLPVATLGTRRVFVVTVEVDRLGSDPCAWVPKSQKHKFMAVYMKLLGHAYQTTGIQSMTLRQLYNELLRFGLEAKSAPFYRVISTAVWYLSLMWSTLLNLSKVSR